MIAFKPSPSSGAPGSISLQARLEAATEALLKTRDQVVQALDLHLSELDSLRRALATTEKPVTPAATPTASSTPGPASASPFPAHYFERPPAQSAPVMPLLTQVLWPSKVTESEMPLHPSSPLPSSAAAVSSPLVAYASMQGSGSRDTAVNPDLERATLEELNAALAQAFSHVSKGRINSDISQALAPMSVTSWAGPDAP